MNETDEVLQTALTGEREVPRADETLVRDVIACGYSPLQGEMQLSFRLEATRSDQKLDAFSATLSYRARSGWWSSHDPHTGHSSASRLDADAISSSLNLKRFGRNLECSWTVVALVRTSFNEHQRWEKSGSFLQP